MSQSIDNTLNSTSTAPPHTETIVVPESTSSFNSAFIYTQNEIVAGLLLTLISYIALRILLNNKRDIWFKRSASSIITLRGALGEYLSLGYPRTKEGALVILAFLCFIFMLWLTLGLLSF